ncbi:carbamoyltransferase HypF [Ectobacillus ponti]|uniref:Carbamoyltransferase n=1 Tax=Ectobacillus ponti TaxID=2961894 RepID=A0AA41X7J7_9BACI|nr:carbamoyltransferase HypF [Ectobacillus ponti]MCP8970364.1 carbamoyltransferase HypF [Ectobacillus ponti]
MVPMDRASVQTADTARLITIRGRVQGVGFRPFLFALARDCSLSGTVQNNMDGIRLIVEGKEEDVQTFLAQLPLRAPRLSRMDEIQVQSMAPAGYAGFSILPSEAEGTSTLVLPADAAICADCLRELYDPRDPRYRYPFINCTQCGPRYTMIESLPYDRPATSMKSFAMCPACREEYENPLSRRHHAQPIACPACGPQLSLFSVEGELTEGEPIAETAALLRSGRIVAIKGIGGYHLACDAEDDGAVQQLRLRKQRPQKPLAIMAKSLGHIRRICHVTPEEEQLLLSPEAPIVLLQKREECRLSPDLAPGMMTLGVMLPYTPLHHLLLDELPYLVMTSANPSGLPMLYREEEAFGYLKGIADYVLSHNRDILQPIDDSVVQMINGETDFIRRARGYAPDPISTKRDVHGIHAAGSRQKNTFAIGRGKQVFLSPHIGDLSHLEMLAHWQKEHHHLSHWGQAAERGVIDMHPGFDMNRLLGDIPLAHVQHHHAHMVSCMEDTGLTAPCFGLILDGTGYGSDGNLWGFELLYGSAGSWKRLGHLGYVPLPGGEQSIREPWRTAVSYLVQTFGVHGVGLAMEVFPERKKEIPILYHLIERKMNTPLAGTCGRLFDAVSAILGICHRSTYEGEAAIKLSELVRFSGRSAAAYCHSLEQTDIWELNMLPMLEELMQDLRHGVPAVVMAERFHETVVQGAAALVDAARLPSHSRRVVLSGGSFHNPYLRTYIRQELEKRGYEVYTHKRVPCNDGGISLGQLIAAAQKGES